MALVIGLRCILFSYLLVVLYSSDSSKHRYHQCVQRYSSHLSKLILVDSSSISAQFNRTSGVPDRNGDGISLYHVGPSTFNVGIDIALTQLNITVQVNGKVSSHCQKLSTSNEFGSSRFIYYGNIDVASQLEYLEGSTTKLILTDHDVKSFLQEKLSSGDCTSQKGCLLPVPFIVDGNNPLLSSIVINSNNIDSIEPSWQLYKDLVGCIVPSESLLVLNGSTLSNPEDYWKSLARFLNSPSDSSVGGNFVTQRTLNSLIKAGIPIMKNGRTCHMNDHVCMYSKINDKNVIVPSVCSLAENIDLVHVTDTRAVTCVHNYVNNLTTLFGERYRRVLLDKMLKPIVMTMYDTQADIILNIGPGSTGTRSLHMAMRQLNVTASHYRMSAQNCECLLAKDGMFVFEGKQLTLDPTRVFWGDTPMVQRWWWYFNYYSRSQTRFIMTDADEQKWLSVRLRDHCQKKNIDFDNGCFVPIPISYFLYNSYHYDSKALTMIQDLAQAAHLTKVNNTVSAVGFQFYRDFLHCVIPPERLLWLDMAKSNNSQVFWSKLEKFLNLDLKPTKFDQLVQAGVPYVGTKGCVISKKPCVYTSFKDKVIPEGKLTSAVIPSVCVD